MHAAFLCWPTFFELALSATVAGVDTLSLKDS